MFEDIFKINYNCMIDERVSGKTTLTNVRSMTGRFKPRILLR